jgi:hypothetical protein
MFDLLQVNLIFVGHVALYLILIYGKVKMDF